MTAREVVLEGGSPWGFRMHGGVDQQQPLRIARVNPGSKAATKGVREGDVITSINGQSTREITNLEAHAHLKSSGDTLKLGLNEDFGGSPKRRQFSKPFQKEIHTEAATEPGWKSATNTLPVKQNQSNHLVEKTPSPIPNGNGEAGVEISQRSTLSSEGFPGHSPPPSHPQTGLVVLHWEDCATDNEENYVIADNGIMGGGSRSSKRRSRKNFRKNRGMQVVPRDGSTTDVENVSDEEVANKSDFSPCEENKAVDTKVIIPQNGEIHKDANNPSDQIKSEKGKTSDDELKRSEEECESETAIKEEYRTKRNSIADAKDDILKSEIIQNIKELSTDFKKSYLVDFPETETESRRSVEKSAKKSAMVKSKSLDDDTAVHISELSENTDTEDRLVTECNAIVSEAESDWEVVEDLDEPKRESASCVTLPLGATADEIFVKLLPPREEEEDEEELKDCVQTWNLVASPEEAAATVQEAETLKAKREKNLQAIVEHFLPEIENPRYLDAICEEGSDLSDREQRELMQSRSKAQLLNNNEDTAEKSAQSTSGNQSNQSLIDNTFSEISDIEENGGDVESGAEDTSAVDDSAVIQPLHKSIPPPTPPKSEDANKKRALIKKIEMSFVQNNHADLHAASSDPLFGKLPEYIKSKVERVLLNDKREEPTKCNSRSSSVSSEASSKTNSTGTVRYNPMHSSIGDVTSLMKDEDTQEPTTLKELCLNQMVSLPFGAEVLMELAEVSQGIEALTTKLTTELPPTLHQFSEQFANREMPAFIPHSKVQSEIPSQLNRDYEQIHSEAAAKVKEQKNVLNRRASSPPRQSGISRLLGIIRESSENLAESANEQQQGDDFLYFVSHEEMASNTKSKGDLNEWLELAREKSVSESNLDSAREFLCPKTQSTNTASRRCSLPPEAYQRHFEYIREKEREIQEELEKLEEEKRKIAAEMAAGVPLWQFEEGKRPAPKSDETKIKDGVPSADSEFFRQKMYDEYMKKFEAREERKMQKIFKISQETATTSTGKSQHMRDLEDEFMVKARERMRKHGLKKEDSEDGRTTDEDIPVKVMIGDAVTDATGLPKHLKEFADITRRAAEEKKEENEDGWKRGQIDARRVNRALSKNRRRPQQSLLLEIDSALVLAKGFLLGGGVWSPGQKAPEIKSNPRGAPNFNEPPSSPIWSPKSAGASPTSERKEFRPVNFESPVLGRKNIPKSKEPPVPGSTAGQVQETPQTNGLSPSVPERRIPTSHSAPASGFDFPSPRLPKAQNPTITLLQKAREGQLPRGAAYIQEPNQHYRRPRDERPPLVAPGEVLYQIKNEYTSDTDSERPRKMADLGQRKFEDGIGPVARDGMPLVLRSEVKDGNQHKWYKKMYDTIHRQKPDKDCVTVRYKQRRERHPYTSGYFSEPEQGGYNAFSADYYDSDGGAMSDNKYATLDRRRAPGPPPPPPMQDKENISYTVPRKFSSQYGDNRSSSADNIIRHDKNPYRSQPGRIANYIPGHSSISDREAKEWWDEVMDIFDGHLEQQKSVPANRGYMSQKRDDAIQQLSPLEQRQVYKNIQKGGDVPLHGLRKAAPERPKGVEIEYFPISPTLTRIRIHKNIKPERHVICYPLSVPPHPPHVFANYKRSAPSTRSSLNNPPVPPSPPKRQSSRNSSTLRLISTMKVRAEKSPISKRHETCFTSHPHIDRKAKPSKDKTINVSPSLRRTSETESKASVRGTRVVVCAPSPSRSNVTCTLSGKQSTQSGTTSKTDVSSRKERTCECSSTRSLSLSPSRKLCKSCSTERASPATEKHKIHSSTTPQIKTKKKPLVCSTSDVRKAAVSSSQSGTIYKKSNAVYASTRNCPKEKILPIRVGVSERGRQLLKSKHFTPTHSLSNLSERSPRSPSISLESLKNLNLPKTSDKVNQKITETVTVEKKTKKLKKTNGDAKRKLVKTKSDSSKIIKTTTVLGKSEFRDEIDSIYSLTQDAVKKQREAIQTNSFFQNLFRTDLISPRPQLRSENSWIAEKTRLLQKHTSFFSEPTVRALKIYLNHTKPVSESKFRSMDAAIMRTRSVSPKYIRWQHREITKEDKERSSSLPPKLFFSETSRPVSPILERRITTKDEIRRRDLYHRQVSRPVEINRSISPSQKMYFSETNRPVSPLIERRRTLAKSISPNSKMYFTETIRPISPTVERKSQHEYRLSRSSSPTSKLYFTESSRPISPLINQKARGIAGSFERLSMDSTRSYSPSSKMYFSETSRPVSPTVKRKIATSIDREANISRVYIRGPSRSESPLLIRTSENRSRSPPINRSYLYREGSESPSCKMYFSDTVRPVSPTISKANKSCMEPMNSVCRSSSSPKLYFSDTVRPVSPVIHRRKTTSTFEGNARKRVASPKFTRSDSPSKMYFTETSRPVSPIVRRKFDMDERTGSPTSKMYFSETNRPLSPLVRRRNDEKALNSTSIYLDYDYEKSNIEKIPKLYFSETSRPVSPATKRRYMKDVIVSERSRSPAAKMYFTETSRPVSPVVQKRTESPMSSSLPVRSPSSRRIQSFRSEERKIHRSSSAGDSDRFCNCNCGDVLHSPQHCSKFKELNDFYSTLERMGELERTTSSELRPRGKHEDEIIGYERWKEVHTRERAEKEMNSLLKKLKHDEKDKGFLFRPKDVESYRWKREFDRGLRIKDRSVESIKQDFENVKLRLTRSSSPHEILMRRDLYKPLWRGSSVSDLAANMGEKRSHSEGRVTALRKKIDTEQLLTRGIGSRIWTSLSSEQINLLKDQLSEIYTNGHKKLDNTTSDYSIEVPEQKIYKTKLSVRRNSESSDHDYKPQPPSKMSTSLTLTESEKKKLSQSLSKELMDHMSQRQKRTMSPSLILPKETRGAAGATAVSVRKSSTTTDQAAIKKDRRRAIEYDDDGLKIEAQKASVSTDATRKVVSMSETESGSTDESTRTVVYLGDKDKVSQKVEYFEQAAEVKPYEPTIYRPAEGSDSTISDNSNDIKPRDSKQLVPSQSCQDLKEFFGERTAFRDDEFFSKGAVRSLKDQFEYLEDFYSNRLTQHRRSRSNPELYRKNVSIPGQATGEVDSLRRRYEYPWIARGRKLRKGGVVSPVCLRLEDRYMPHINIISKIATLYPNKTVFLSQFPQQSREQIAKMLGCPTGEVDRLRQKFDSSERHISLLGHMFTSSPNISELRDIAPYLTASWTAHKFPKSEDNIRSLSSPDRSPSGRGTSPLRRDRANTTKPSPILKQRKETATKSFNPKTDPVSRYQPPHQPVRYKEPSWPHSVRFKEPEAPIPPPKGNHGIKLLDTESPRKYVENEVTIHYKTPVRQEVKESMSEEELARRQADHMRRVYEDERRRKYLQVSDSGDELQDINNRRHADNFIPSQKSPISLNRYDDFPLIEDKPRVKPRPRSPEPRLMARALYNFVGQSARELTFRKGEVIFIRRQVDKNWYEGELNAMIGLFPANYVEIIPFDGVRSTSRKAHEGQARAKFNFIAQTHLELSLAKGEFVVITRRVDNNWFEGRIGGRKGIFPVSYVELLVEPSEAPAPSSKPIAAPAAHSILLNGSASGKESMGSHSYIPTTPSQQFTASYHAKPAQVQGGNYGSLSRSESGSKNPLNETLHIDTHSEPIPYRALYKYHPQNDDELELLEGDVVYVLEKCDDGWYVGSSQRTGSFGTFPGNYVEKI